MAGKSERAQIDRLDAIFARHVSAARSILASDADADISTVWRSAVEETISELSPGDSLSSDLVTDDLIVMCRGRAWSYEEFCKLIGAKPRLVRPSRPIPKESPDPEPRGAHTGDHSASARLAAQRQEIVRRSVRAYLGDPQGEDQVPDQSLARLARIREALTQQWRRSRPASEPPSKPPSPEE